jgi:Protein of unknown function (DUF2510)
MDVERVVGETKATLRHCLDLANAEVKKGRVVEATAILATAQRELQETKAEVVAAQQHQTLQLSPTGEPRAGVPRLRAADKRAFVRRQRANSEQYRVMNAVLDDAIRQLIRTRVEIFAKHVRERDAPKPSVQSAINLPAPILQTATPPTPPTPPNLPSPTNAAPTASAPQAEPTASAPQWAADPFGRFQLRYWDGSRWTEHVRTWWRQEVDPDYPTAD